MRLTALLHSAIVATQLHAPPLKTTHTASSVAMHSVVSCPRSFIAARSASHSCCVREQLEAAAPGSWTALQNHPFGASASDFAFTATHLCPSYVAPFGHVNVDSLCP